jgi:hypothetical protein
MLGHLALKKALKLADRRLARPSRHVIGFLMAIAQDSEAAFPGWLQAIWASGFPSQMHALLAMDVKLGHAHEVHPRMA